MKEVNVKSPIVKKLANLLTLIIMVVSLVVPAMPVSAAIQSEDTVVQDGPSLTTVLPAQHNTMPEPATISYMSSKVGTSPYEPGFVGSDYWNEYTYLQIAKPLGMQVGDFLLAAIVVNGGNLADITAPPGWNLIRRSNAQLNDYVCVATYYRFADSSDVDPESPSSYEWRYVYQNGYYSTLAVGGIIRYAGVDPTFPVDVVSDNQGTGYENGTNITSAPVVTRCPDDRVVTIYGTYVPVEEFSVPEELNYINYIHYHLTKDQQWVPWAYPSLGMFDKAQPTAGPSGARTTTITLFDKGRITWAAQTISLKTVLPTPTVNVTGNATVMENAAGVADVHLDYPMSDTVTVHCAVGGTAVRDTDYTIPNWSTYVDASGTITFDPGESAAPLTIQPINNAIHDGNKTVTITISNPTNAPLGPNTTYSTTIVDDDPINYVNIAGTNPILESASGQANVILTYASSDTVTMHCDVSGTAVRDTDYTIPNWSTYVDGSGTLTIPAGQAQLSLQIQPVIDYVHETDKTIVITVSDPTVAVLGPDNVYLTTLTDDDPVNALAISDAPGVDEGDTGTRNATFTVTLSPSASWPVTVNYATADGGAKSSGASDYVAKSGTLTFSPGQTQKTINIPVNGDNIYESNEVFYVNLSNPDGASITDIQGRVIIFDDDVNKKPVINEFVINHEGDDTNEFIEIYGEDSTDYSDFRILVIENDGDQNPGVIDRIYTVGTTDPWGYWRTPFLHNELEDGSCILLLVEHFTGTVGQDVDPNNLRFPTIYPWDTSSASTFGMIDIVPLFNPLPMPGYSYNFPYLSDTYGASRDPDRTGDWVKNDFGGTGLPGFTPVPQPGQAYNTPGDYNHIIPSAVYVEFDLGGHAERTGGGELGQWISPGGEAVAPVVTADPGWRFLGWYPRFDYVISNLVVHASYAEATDYVNVSPIAGLTTTESGGTASFSVNLSTQPAADVTMSLSSSNTAEGTVSPASLTFTTDNWSTAQEVTVTGVNDLVFDGNITYTIIIGAAVSTDPVYGGTDVHDVSVTNADDDMPVADQKQEIDPNYFYSPYGYADTPALGQTFTVGAPGRIEKIDLYLDSVSDTSVTAEIRTVEGGSPSGTVLTSSTLSVSALSRGWVEFAFSEKPLLVGGTQYAIVLTKPNNGVQLSWGGTAGNPYPNGAGMTLDDTEGWQVNDSTMDFAFRTYMVALPAGFTINPTSGLTTTEYGGAANFTVRLDNQPTADVVVGFSIDDPTEGTVSPDTLTFTPSNWNVPQKVTVTGADDTIDDGDIAYHITVSPASSDPIYNGMAVPDIIATNLDDDYSLVVNAANGTVTRSPDQAAFTAGSQVILTASPDTGYSFVDWSGDTSSAENPLTITMDSDKTITANIAINTYVVTFDSQGGSSVASQNVNYGGTVNPPAAPTRTGYTFENWYREAACANLWDFAAETISSDTVIYANWTIDTYTVTFDPRGGTPTPPSQDVIFGGLVTRPVTDPAKTGEVFHGWYQDEACTDAWVFETDTVPSDITIYAGWATLDQHLESVGTYAPVGGVPYAQTFTADKSGSLDMVSFTLHNNYAFTLTTQIQGVTPGGMPNGTVLANSTVSLTAGGSRSINVLFTDPCRVRAGTQYAIVWSGFTSGTEASIGWVQPGVFGEDYYTGGAALEKFTTFGWGPLPSPTGDFVFRTYVFEIPIITYSVTYDANGGSGTPPVETPKEAETTFAAAANSLTAPASQRFKEWNTLADGTGAGYAPGASITMPANNLALYAIWEDIPVYTVVFDSRDGSAVPGQNVLLDGLVTRPANPTKTGYVFMGWYKDADCTDDWIFETDTVTSDITLYARWAILDQHLESIGSGSPVGGVPYAQTFTADKSGSLDMISLSLYNNSPFTLTTQIQGVTPGGMPDGTVLANSTVNLTAGGSRWINVVFTDPCMVRAGRQYAIVWSGFANAQASLSFVPGNSYTGGNAVENYSVFGWGPVPSPTGDFAFRTYVFEIPLTTYTVTYDANGGSGTAPAESPKADGDIFQAAANSFTAPTGKRFIEWNTADNGSGAGYAPGASITMPANNLTLYAIWEDIPTFTLTVNATNGTVAKNPDQATYFSGTPVELTASPADGYHFTGWSGDAGGTTDQLTVIMDGNKSITANFALNTFTITPSAGPGGSITPGTPQTVDWGTAPSFAIAPDNGYHIADVMVDGTTSVKTFLMNGVYTFPAVTADHTITATFANDPPTISDIPSQETGEDVAISGIAFTVGDTETLADSLLLSKQSSDTALVPLENIVFGGSGANRTVSITPASNKFGTVAITISVKDELGVETVDAFELVINPVNDLPVAQDDIASTDEDIPVKINVLSNDSDIDGDNLTIEINNAPSNGIAIVEADKTIKYTPDPDSNGEDSFIYAVNDGNGGTDTAEVRVTVKPVNDPPVAQDDSYNTDEDTPLTITVLSVLSNDTDIDGLSLAVSQTTGPAHGTLTVNSDASFTYTPAADYNGPDSFTYRANDGSADSNEATVKIAVAAVNDAPVAAGANIATDEDTARDIKLIATDIDSNQLIYAYGSPAHGTLSGYAPDLIYTPDSNYNGPDSFTFKVLDGLLTSNTATVSITVNPVNDAPVTTGDTAAVDEDSSANTIKVLTNDTDPEDDILSIKAVSVPSHGKATFEADSLSYTPDPDYYGKDSFIYTVSDGNGGEATGVVEITVNNLNDQPVAASDAATMDEDSGATAIPVLDNDSYLPDPPETLTIKAVTQGANGAVVITGGGTGLTYEPDANINGPDSFTYTISDGNGGEATASVSITVNSVNDAPTSIGLSNSSLAENLAAGTVVGTFSTADVDTGDTFTYTLESGDIESFIIEGNAINTAAVFDYEAKASYTIVIKSTDQGNLYNETTFTITVDNVPENPTITTEPFNRTAFVGQTAEFTAAASGDQPMTVQWQLSTNGGKRWTDIAAGAPATVAGVTSSVYTIPSAAVNMNGYQYRAVFSNSLNSATTKTVSLTVNSPSTMPPAITSASSATFNVGAFGSFTVTATGNPAPVVTCEGNLPDGVTFNSATATLSGIATAEGSYQVTVKASNGISPDATQYFTLNVVATNDAPTDISLSNTSVNENLPAGTTVGVFSTTDPNNGNTFTYTLAAGDGSTDNGNFTISGNTLRTAGIFDYETRSSYTITVRTTDQGGLFCEEPFTITVNDVTETAPVITSQPVDRMVYSGQTATFTAAASGNPAPTVQWQLSTNGGNLWNDIPGATSTSYTTQPATSNMDGYQYRAVFTNEIGSTATNAAALRIATVMDSTMDARIAQNPGVYDSATKTITWTLTVSNTKNNPALDVTVTDTLAGGTKVSNIIVPAGVSYKVTGSTVTVAIPTLSKPDSVVITIEALVTKATGTVSNTATLTTGNVDSDLTNNSSTATVTVNR